MLHQTWRIEMFAGLKARQGERLVSRFRTRKTGELLGYLACFPERAHPREELIERLWPDDETDSARTKLRMALSSLRRQLESQESSGCVLLAERDSIRLHPAAFTSDVADFEQALRSAAQAMPGEAQARFLAQACAEYQGEFLPGCYAEWAQTERGHLAGLHLRALTGLADLLEQTGDFDGAFDYALRAISLDPLQETSHLTLMRLHLRCEQPAAALRQYQQLERALRDELGMLPSPIAQSLAASLFTLAPSVTPQFASSAPISPPAIVSKRGSAQPDSAPSPAAPPMSRLPVVLTRFFGREAELQNILELLQSHAGEAEDAPRLVTLTGPGGAGKTRLAVEISRRIVAEGKQGACFVPLAEVTEADYVFEAIARCMELPSLPQNSQGEPSGEEQNRLRQIADAAGNQSLLLILDNFEQIAGESAARVLALLQAAPTLQCLVTSRHHLGLTGERIYPVLSLSSACSRQLFVDRAQAVKPDFQITPGNAAAIEALCARLEGIPLALELAAGWALTLTPARMLARLEDRFTMLVSRKNDLSARHRTLRAAIAWSYDLLPPELQWFFAALAVFRGGWSVEAAQAVCREERVLEYLQMLRERSLILAEESHETLRFSMLESLREFAREQIGAGRQNELEARHSAFFLKWAQDADADVSGAGQSDSLARLEAEHDNLRKALAWAESAEGAVAAPGMALQFTAALWFFWSVRGHLTEGRERLARVLEQALRDRDTSTRALFDSLNGAGNLAHMQGDYKQAEYYRDRAIETAVQLGDKPLTAVARVNMACGLMNAGKPEEARRLFVQVLADARQAGDGRVVAAVLTNLANIATDRADYTEAQTLLEESLALRRVSGDKRALGITLLNLANALHYQGECEEALELIEESLAIRRQLGDKRAVANALYNLGQMAQGSGDTIRAYACQTESLQLRRELGDKDGLACSLDAFAHLLLETQPESAAMLYGASAAIRQEIGRTLPANEREERDACRHNLAARLGEMELARLEARGSRKTLEQALELARMQEHEQNAAE